MVTLWIRVALSLLGAVLVHSAAFLAGMGEPLAIVVGLVVGPLISGAILAWAPLTRGPAPTPVEQLEVQPAAGSTDAAT